MIVLATKLSTHMEYSPTQQFSVPYAQTHHSVLVTLPTRHHQSQPHCFVHCIPNTSDATTLLFAHCPPCFPIPEISNYTSSTCDSYLMYESNFVSENPQHFGTTPIQRQCQEDLLSS